MEMKLNSKLIRELRLARSWTQEQLAEKARLNARTIQRVEMDGQGSLRTRAQLALALGVSPGELDVVGEAACRVNAIRISGWRAALQDYMDSMSLQALTLQLLVTVFFVVSGPVYLSLSRSGFIFNTYLIAGNPNPWPHWPAWWSINFAVWALFSAPLLAWVWKRQRQWFWRAGMAATITLFLSVLRLWQTSLVGDLVSQAVFVAGLILLACQWLPRVSRVHAEHLLYGCLHAYVYLWCFQVLAYFGARFVFKLSLVETYGLDVSFPVDLWRAFESLINRLAGLTELLPVLCVWLLGRGQHGDAGSSSFVAVDKQGVAEQPAKGPSGPFFEQQLLEN